MSHWNKTASSAAFILSTALAATGCLAPADATEEQADDAEIAAAPADAKTGEAREGWFNEHFCHAGLFNYNSPFYGQFGGGCCGFPFFGGGVGAPFLGVGAGVVGSVPTAGCL
jgi:hypothetical protein